MAADVHEYEMRQYAVALDREMSGTSWSELCKSDPGTYGSSEAKATFLAAEVEARKQRSEAWGRQAVSLRDHLRLRPARVDADGACGLSSLSVATGGTASHEEKESLRETVLMAAPKILEDDRFQKLLLFLLK